MDLPQPKRRVMQTSVSKMFGHLAKQYPNAALSEVVEKMEQDLRAYPKSMVGGQKKIWSHVELTQDDIAWLAEVLRLMQELGLAR